MVTLSYQSKNRWSYKIVDKNGKSVMKYLGISCTKDLATGLAPISSPELAYHLVSTENVNFGQIRLQKSGIQGLFDHSVKTQSCLLNPGWLRITQMGYVHAPGQRSCS